MSRFQTVLAQRDAHVWSLRGLLAALLLCNVLLAFAWYRAPEELVIHLPPDLRSGSTRLAAEVPPQSIYAFSFYVFQQLHRWPVDGARDYPKRIATLNAYFTPRFAADLADDVERKRAEHALQGRQRAVFEAGPGYTSAQVDIHEPDRWVVHLHLQVVEHYRGEVVKDATIHYPVVVVRRDADPERNPYGLALDGFAEAPSRAQFAGGA